MGVALSGSLLYQAKPCTARLRDGPFFGQSALPRPARPHPHPCRRIGCNHMPGHALRRVHGGPPPVPPVERASGLCAAAAAEGPAWRLRRRRAHCATWRPAPRRAAGSCAWGRSSRRQGTCASCWSAWSPRCWSTCPERGPGAPRAVGPPAPDRAPAAGAAWPPADRAPHPALHKSAPRPAAPSRHRSLWRVSAGHSTSRQRLAEKLSPSMTGQMNRTTPAKHGRT